MRHNTALGTLLALAALTTSPALGQWSTESLSQARGELSAVSVGDFVLFAGGRIGGSVYDAVDIYQVSTDTWSTAPLSVARSHMGATVVGDLAMFAGGIGPGMSSVVDVFDAQSMTWSTATLSQARHGVAATTVGSRAMFAGGAASGVKDVVDVYDASVGPPDSPAAWSTATLSQARAEATAVTIGDLAIFAGGWIDPGGIPVDRVDIYDASLGAPDFAGAWSTASLSEPRILGLNAGAVVGTRAYFAGGHTSASGGPNMSDRVDVYDALTRAWSFVNLSVARGYLSATAVGNTVLFAGGNETGHVPSNVVESFNVGTGDWSSMALPSIAGRSMSATSAGGMALFAGGLDSAGVTSNVIDVYEPVGTNYCVGEQNSTGAAGTMSALGSTSLTDNDLELRATGLPDQPCIFFHGAAQVQVPFGNGYLCASGDIVRLNPPIFVSGGTATRSVDVPSEVGSAGSRHFQCWFRDPAGGGASFNTTDAYSITFVP